jgi:hypothetical protein
MAGGASKPNGLQWMPGSVLFAFARQRARPHADAGRSACGSVQAFL